MDTKAGRSLETFKVAVLIDPNYSVDGGNLGGQIFAVDDVLLEERPATLRHRPSSMLTFRVRTEACSALT